MGRGSRGKYLDGFNRGSFKSERRDPPVHRACLSSETSEGDKIDRRPFPLFIRARLYETAKDSHRADPPKHPSFLFFTHGERSMASWSARHANLFHFVFQSVINSTVAARAHTPTYVTLDKVVSTSRPSSILFSSSSFLVFISRSATFDTYHHVR